MSNQECSTEGFCGVGRWRGCSEVYSGDGRFLGNGSDDRHVRTLTEDGRTRIDLAFIGPFKFAGHYHIQEFSDRRLYQGPANYGYAEPLGKNLVDANAYWPAVGLTQRFFLMVLPDGNHQLSLALMQRGEHLLYVVVGEYARVVGDGPGAMPGLLSGTSHDFARDPSAGRGQALLHRAGEWTGELSVLDPDLRPAGGAVYRERFEPRGEGITWEVEGGGFGAKRQAVELVTDGYDAWTHGGPVVGSYSMSGGRALSGTFHHLAEETRVWRREVVQQDGALKAVVHVWYRGGRRIGAQHGVLKFSAK